VLEVKELSVSYGAIEALVDVSMRVETGSVTAVLGANGAGKTTLVRTISGLVRPRKGGVLLDGEDITGVAVENIVRKGIAHVPEGRGVIEDLTVDENLRLGGLWRRGDQRSVLDGIYELFEPLSSRRTRSAATLSGGERQMLAIGRALASQPSVLLLDEPSLGLAPIVTAQLMAVIRDLVERTRLTVVLIEQNARSALSIAAEAVVLNLGRVVMTGPAESLTNEEDLRRNYLGY
jgi:branched-chain amino acid transport system ATP-binding protein